MWKRVSLMILSVLVPSLSLAQIPVDSPFSLPTDPAGEHRFPVVAGAPNGDFVVVWQRTGSPSDDGWGIEGRRFSSDGSPLGAPFQVNTYTTNAQTNPAVAIGSDGRFTVVWTSLGSELGDAEKTSVHGRRFAADGSPLGDPFQISSTTAVGRQHGAEIALDADDNEVVTWRSEAGYQIYVYGKRYSRNGDELGSQFLVWDRDSQPGRDSGLAVGPDGEIMVVRPSERYTPSFGSDIQARRFSADGTPLGSIFVVNGEAEGSHWYSDITAAPDGSFWVAWQAEFYPDPERSRIHARRFGAGGEPLTDPFQVETEVVYEQTLPDVAVAPDGDFAVVWRTPTVTFAGGSPPGYLPGIHGRFFSSDGQPLDLQFPVDLVPDSFPRPNFWHSDAALSAEGDLFVVWEREDDGIWGAYGRRFCTDDDGDGSCNRDDLCKGDDRTGDSDGDGVCNDVDVCDGNDPAILCLHEDRYRAEVQWRDVENRTGAGQTVFSSKDSGLFWFFDADNWEMLVKVLDGCDVNGHTWVFAAATTDVEYTLKVTDTHTGIENEYANRLGEAAPALTDTTAFATCP